MTALLEVENLGVHLPGDVPVIHDATLRVDEGEVVGVAGESGSGKSMTASALLGLLPPGARTTGAARLHRVPQPGGTGTVDLLALRGAEWNRVRGTEIAMVFQDATASLHPMLSVGRQLTEHMRVHLGMDRRAARRRAVELLDRVRIPDPERALRAYPHQFSGGMRQRVAIASALACRPRLLIADEPTTALDVTVQAGILRLLDELRTETGLSVLFVTHDLGVLASLTARSYVFYAGRVMETAATPELVTRPRHPYTAALLGARPHADETWGQPGARQPLQSIPGSPVTPATAPPGCPFAPRCTHAVEECTTAVPTLSGAGPTGHELACVVRPNLTEASA